MLRLNNYILFVQVNNYHLSNTNHEAHTNKYLINANKITTSELIKSESGHMDTWVYQICVKKTRPKNLSNTPDQQMMHPPHLDLIRGGMHNTVVRQHLPTHYQTI
jgi:spore germination protein YaaH